MTIEEKAKAYDKAIIEFKPIYDLAKKQGRTIDVKEFERIFPELKENEDENIDEKVRKALIKLVTNHASMDLFIEYDIHLDEALSWLEKQGEQKTNDVRTTGYWNVQDIEQKPTDKVEHKFKVGDWIYHEESGNIFHINKIENRTYISEEGATISFGRQNDWRLWTIQDAKDGDLLAVERDKTPFIFKGFDKFHPGCPVAYCGICNDGIFANSGDSWWTDEKVKPTTKEQRDLLFQKMKEAGYEWDAEKKELKKIEQKPDNSKIIDLDELVIELEETIGTSPHSREIIKDFFQKAVQKYLKCLQIANGEIGRLIDENYHLKEQKSAAWSEEDEGIIKRIDSLFYAIKKSEFEDIHTWLKSLKERYTWKPSEKQMNVLWDSIKHNLNLHPVLESLYKDLKKLKE